MHKPILITGSQASGKSTFARQFVKNTNHIYANQQDIDNGNIHNLLNAELEYVLFDGVSIKDNTALEKLLFDSATYYAYMDIVFIIITNETLENIEDLKQSFQVIECKQILW